MNIIVWLIVGGIIGWLASMIMRTDAQQGILLNIVVGIVGAFIGNFVLGLVGVSIGGSILAAIINAFIGAVILLFLIGLIKRA